MILFLVVIVIAACIGLPIMSKKKKLEKSKALVSSRRSKDEVWKSIKQYLKDTNQYGCEIVESYVAKRNSIDYINPNLSKQAKKKLREENRLRDYQYKTEKQKSKKNQEKVRFTKPPIRDIYVVCFQTRDSKTKIVLPPQAIECEVKVKQVDKKNQDRRIVINGAVDYDKEMQWIAPLRAAESEKNIKDNKIRKKQELKEKKKLTKVAEKKKKNDGKKK